jgi:hypothetical protein
LVFPYFLQKEIPGLTLILRNIEQIFRGLSASSDFPDLPRRQGMGVFPQAPPFFPGFLFEGGQVPV